MLKVAVVLGTRPEIIKMSPIIRELIGKKVNFFIIHSNQHYTANMDKKFIQELQLPKPKYNVGVSFETYHGRMTGKMLIGIEEILQKEKPDWILVEGDTNTVLAGALTACKMGIKVGHVEAGLRSYDMSMPEEVNRILTDHVSDALFCPTIVQKRILSKEGIGIGKIFVTGNTIVDAVFQNLKLAEKKMSSIHLPKNDYFLLTLHRPLNVDKREILEAIIKVLEKAVDIFGYPIYFPVHPRTKKQMEAFAIKVDPTKIKMIEPLGYLEMLIVEKNAELILTDSGGLQEEACILGIPCVTLRENTERPETLTIRSNILVGHSSRKIIKGIKIMLSTNKKWKNPFGDGTAAQKIVSIIN